MHFGVKKQGQASEKNFTSSPFGGWWQVDI